MSFSGSANPLTARTYKTVEELFKREAWFRVFTPELIIWNSERPASWAFSEAPNDAIAVSKGAPDEADMHLVLLTASLGEGTLDEMFRRLDARGEFHIYLMDERPPRTGFPSEEAFEAADKAYDEMMRWLREPVREVGGRMQSLGVRFPENRVQSTTHLHELLTTKIERELCELRDDIARSDVKPSMATTVLPYAGLQPLDEANESYFFGREGKTEEIVNLVSRGERRILLEGGSGTGKSSLVRAGVIPKLRKKLPDLQIVAITPRDFPFRELAVGLHRLSTEGLPEKSFVTRLRDRPDHQVDKFCEGLGGPLVVFIDQFETIYAERVQTKSFFATLECLLARSEVTLIVAHRADQKQRWTNRSFLPEVRSDGSEGFRFQSVELAPLNTLTMPDVVLKPAVEAGIPPPEDALILALNSDLKDSRNWLPLMALTLRELYIDSERGKRAMSLASYQRMGRIRGIVQRKVEEVEDECDKGMLDRLPKLFELLVAVNADGEAYAVGADLEQIAKEGIKAEWLDPLIQGALLVTDANGVALAHELYFDQWPRLKEWLEHSRDVLREIDHLAREAKRWDSKGRLSYLLLNRERLREARSLLRGASLRGASLARLNLETIVAEFLAASESHLGSLVPDLLDDIESDELDRLETQLVIRQLRRDARLWDKSDQSAGYLLTGERLADAERLTAVHAALVAGTLEAEAIGRLIRVSRGVSNQDQLRKAIVEGEIERILPLLHKGIELALPDADDPLAAIHDCIWGAVESEQAIRTPDPKGLLNPRSIRNSVAKGFVALHFGAAAGRVDKIRKLHALGADLDAASTGGSTALAWAAYAGQVEAVKVLLALGASLDVPRDVNSLPAIGWAAERGHTEIVEILTRAEAGGTEQVPSGTLHNLVLAAASGGKVADLARYLAQLAAATDISASARTDILTQGLWYAIGQHHAACVRLLLAAGADAKRPMAKTDGGATSIHMTLTGAPDNPGLLATLDELLAHDPELALAVDGSGWQAIHIAANRGDDQALGKLLEYSISSNERGPNGVTALAMAVHGNKPRCVEQLLAIGADPNLPDKNGDTPLHLAGMNGHENVARLLLRDVVIDIAQPNARGYTPLMLAARNGHFQIVEALLRTGRAALDQTDRHGWTALVHAVVGKREPVVDRLLSAGAHRPLFTAVARPSAVDTGTVAAKETGT